MRALVQRVNRACVRVDGAVVGECGRGLLVLLGVFKGDGEREVRRLAERVAHLRLFPDGEQRMNRSALDDRLAALVVSQFTLAADTTRGRRPSFDPAADPETAQALYERFVAELGRLGIPTATGRFGARMAVELENDGPVTFLLDEGPAGAPRPGPGTST